MGFVKVHRERVDQRLGGKFSVTNKKGIRVWPQGRQLWISCFWSVANAYPAQNKIWDHFSFHFPSWAQELHQEAVCHEWDEGGCGPDLASFWAVTGSLHGSLPYARNCAEVQEWDLPATQESHLRSARTRTSCEGLFPAILSLYCSPLPASLTTSLFPLAWLPVHLICLLPIRLSHPSSGFLLLFFPSSYSPVSLTVHLTLHHLLYSSLYAVSLFVCFFFFLPVCPLLVSSSCYKNLPGI